ncbi:hypothetical protein ACFV4M_18805 [Kitasatospora indigofera]|uniref:hypothetical protein n=1 Tax=Kitasatospora indigofera TaxID=67307 RepID=UPI003669BF37
MPTTRRDHLPGHPDGQGFFGASQRADDVLLTRPVLVGTSWADRLGDYSETYLPSAEWRDRR